jgi:FKBP-type peptidyl-prolyl cis-trans isomerase
VRFSPRSRSLLLVVPVLAVSLLAACGDDSTTAGSDDTAAPATAAPSDDTTVGSPSDSASDSVADAPVDECADANAPLEKPTVDFPGEAPEELKITDIETGEGPAAREGDTVVVHYVGVRSLDGVEFDNSYERGEPFPVPLGQGQVIAGWDQGLVGIQAGGIRQLDIPSDLAYGETARSEVIRENEPLTFLVEAVAVLPVTDPADAPDVTVEPTDNVDELVVDDVVVGDGAELERCQTAAVHLIAFNAATGEQLASSWESGQLQPVPFQDGGSLPGVIDGMDGMKVGGRRQLQIPYEEAFGAEGNPDFGLPGATDMILVVDLIAAY